MKSFTHKHYQSVTSMLVWITIADVEPRHCKCECLFFFPLVELNGVSIKMLELGGKNLL